MNQTQAIAKLRKLLGAKFAYRLDPKAPDAEGREKIRAEWQEASRAAVAAMDARKARYEELLKDPRYQELKKAAKIAEETARKMSGRLHSYRVTVGRAGALFFSVDAQGDDWQEVVDKVTKEKGPK